jgi:cytochrome c oxidase assembly protein subunit 15
MVVVGGATRLTDSGLSITQWRPVTGSIPPLNAADWASEFAKYKQIPQYVQLNQGMTLEAFKTIYWWEWSHRLLGRLVGLACGLPLVWFLARRELPRRLVWRCLGLFALGGLQGAVGWWMVASGLTERVSVAPERLMTHLGLAFILLGALVWTALEAAAGASRVEVPSPWRRWTLVLLAMVYVQILLGALVAGNDAGLVFNDWPLMNGRLFPEGYAGPHLWATMAHSQAAVQLHHRLGAYILLIVAAISGWKAVKSPYLPDGARMLGLAVAMGVLFQAVLGVATLMARVPLSLGIIHQVAAAIVLCLATAFAWRVRRL